MGTTEQCIDVAVPLTTAYNHWTQFEDFPEFMEGVELIERLDETHLRWKMRLAGVAHEFDAEIVEQRPDACVAWCATTGATHAGTVTLQRVDDATTRVFVAIEEDFDAPPGFLARRVAADLERFKAAIAARDARLHGDGRAPAP
jgi:uncharacterized membrane protein